jgi:hypothetical protein
VSFLKMEEKTEESDLPELKEEPLITELDN